MNTRYGVIRVINTRINWLQRTGNYLPRTSKPEVWETDERERAYQTARANHGLCAQLETDNGHGSQDNAHGLKNQTDTFAKPTHRNNKQPDEPQTPVSEEQWQTQAKNARALIADLRQQINSRTHSAIG